MAFMFSITQYKSTASRYYIERRLIPNNKYTTRLQHLIKPHLTRPSGFYFISWSWWVRTIPWLSKLVLLHMERSVVFFFF
jgi:hypothetical protein